MERKFEKDNKIYNCYFDKNNDLEKVIIKYPNPNNLQWIKSPILRNLSITFEITPMTKREEEWFKKFLESLILN